MMKPMRKPSLKFLSLFALFLLSASSVPANASLCGMAGSDAALPGESLTGYWQSTLGLMRLVQTGPLTVEGPAAGSEYLRGSVAGTIWQGRFAIDTGEFHTGTFHIEMTEKGRCLKGSLTYDDGGTDEVLGQRVPKPSLRYKDFYEITPITEHLKQIVGGLLNLNLIDGPDRQIVTIGGDTPPPIPPAPVSAQSPSAANTPEGKEELDVDSIDGP